MSNKTTGLLDNSSQAEGAEHEHNVILPFIYDPFNKHNPELHIQSETLWKPEEIEGFSQYREGIESDEERMAWEEIGPYAIKKKPTHDPEETAQNIRTSFDRGLAEGQLSGFKSGQKAGWKRGFEEGQESGHAEGYQEGSSDAERSLADIHAELLAKSVAQLDAMYQERDRYLNSVEHQVVRLALAIAARILEHEVSLDPLALMPAVQAALSQLPEISGVKLRVCQADREIWQKALDAIPHLAPRPEVIADIAMHAGECRLETVLGSANLGIWPQMQEVEHLLLEHIAEGKQ